MGCESTGHKLGICYSFVVDVFPDEVEEKGRRLVEDVLRSTECLTDLEQKFLDTLQRLHNNK